MMRAFGNRADVAEVRDEPFYAAYLAMTGKDHPMRAEVLAAAAAGLARRGRAPAPARRCRRASSSIRST